MTTKAKLAVDIGSTVVKIAKLGAAGEMTSQEFFPRDFQAGIAKQVTSLLSTKAGSEDGVIVCSSANGGLRVGIVCLTKRFSGAVLRNQALLAGANPVFVHDFEESREDLNYVDILLVGGGIDCQDGDPLQRRLESFNPEKYRYGALVFAGNEHLAAQFQKRFPKATIVANPLGEELAGNRSTVFELVRRAYLDDLIYKEGVSELKHELSYGIRPTPEIVNIGFQRLLQNRSSMIVASPCVLLDIGGATTDLHYTWEIIREDSPVKATSNTSIARYVFTDLGIVASRDSLMLQLRSHPRLYDFLSRVLPDDVRRVYQLLREGEYSPSPELLSYGCLFLALDRFAKGRGPGLPSGDLPKIAQLLLTGGAAQTLSEPVIKKLFDLLLDDKHPSPAVHIDRAYQIWVDGIVWAATSAG